MDSLGLEVLLSHSPAASVEVWRTPAFLGLLLSMVRISFHKKILLGPRFVGTDGVVTVCSGMSFYGCKEDRISAELSGKASGWILVRSSVPQYLSLSIPSLFESARSVSR